MSLQTGGRAIGATSTRSRSDSAASSSALPIGTMPTCSPSGPTRRTSGTRIRSLIRGSELMWPPKLEFWVGARIVLRRNDKGPAATNAVGATRNPVVPVVRLEPARQTPRGTAAWAVPDRTRPPLGLLGWETLVASACTPLANERRVGQVG